eukprot:Seg2541.1 transcript_id=Seg2541.1/GoldUCD/mRNA.D3Y31 product="hypothetical protein" protein_id=Seg2541.1/GoldUCD/D3Y31
MKSSVLNSANKDRSTSSCEQVNNSVNYVNSKMQIEINSTVEASTSTASALNVRVSDVSSIVNAAEPHRSLKSQRSAPSGVRCDQNVNNNAVENAVSAITPDSVTPISSSNAINEQLPS